MRRLQRPLFSAFAILLALAGMVAAVLTFGALQAMLGLALILLAVCALLSWVFVARHSRTRWWATWEGRYMMRSKVAMALLFSVTLLGQVIPMRPLTAVSLSVLLFGWTAYVFVDLIHMQTVALREARVARDRRIAEDDMRQTRLARLHQHEQQHQAE